MKVVTSLFIFLLLTIQSAFCNDSTHCLFPVKLDDKWGFIDNNQKLAISYQFDSVGYFSEELALAELNGLWGYIDGKGTFVISPQFKYAEPFLVDLQKLVPMTQNILLFLSIKMEALLLGLNTEVFSDSLITELLFMERKRYCI